MAATALVALCLAGPAAAKPPERSGGPPDHAGGGRANPDAETVDSRVNEVIEAATDRLLGSEEKAVIREYFEPYRDGRRDLPPGLASKDRLPPGLARRDKLPPGLQGKALPPVLEARLPSLDPRWTRELIGDNLVLIDRDTDVIVDILRDVF